MKAPNESVIVLWNRKICVMQKRQKHVIINPIPIRLANDMRHQPTLNVVRRSQKINHALVWKKPVCVASLIRHLLLPAILRQWLSVAGCWLALSGKYPHLH